MNWDVDVAGGKGSLNVFEKIYWRRTGSEEWNFFYKTERYTITGTSGEDARYFNITGGSHDEYDWRIEVYRVVDNEGIKDHTVGPANNRGLRAYKMETKDED